MSTPETLPDEVDALIAQQKREGVLLQVDRPASAGHRTVVTGIRWRPGDPNPLAAIILRKVTEADMPLELDGHEFLIRRKPATE
jgi:hypothetical protein